MAVKETIWAALQKGDLHDRAFRETVYRQVFAALERSVKTNPDLSADDVFRRREQVVAMIAEIENEISAREVQPAWDVEPSPVEPGAPLDETPDGPQPDFMPSVSREERLTGDTRPFDPALLDSRSESRRQRRSRKRMNPLVRLVLWLAVLALIVWGGWWLWRQATEAVRTGGASIEEIIGADRDQGPTAYLPSREDSEWIEVFTPSDASTVRAMNGAGASISRGDEGDFLSIGGGQGQSQVDFQVGQGALEQFVGQTVTFSLRARAQEDETQVTVTCDFGSLGQCNRIRYVVGPTTADYLFEVDLANGSAAGGGTISVTPDIEGQGRMLDVFSIKMTAE